MPASRAVEQKRPARARPRPADTGGLEEVGPTDWLLSPKPALERVGIALGLCLRPQIAQAGQDPQIRIGRIDQLAPGRREGIDELFRLGAARHRAPADEQQLPVGDARRDSRRGQRRAQPGLERDGVLVLKRPVADVPLPIVLLPVDEDQPPMQRWDFLVWLALACHVEGVVRIVLQGVEVEGVAQELPEPDVLVAPDSGNVGLRRSGGEVELGGRNRIR